MTAVGPGRGPRRGEADLERLLAAFLARLPADDAAASVLGTPFEPEILLATSGRAARLDEAQIDLGQGPAWDACRTYRPVEMVPGSARDFAFWPMFALSADAAKIGSIVAVPMVVGTSSIGAVTLYSSRETRLGADQLHFAERLSGVLARAFVEQVTTSDESGAPPDAALSRREVHQATGMVVAQTKSTPADALLMIRAYAFAEDMSVRRVAADIVARKLDFSPDRPG